MADYRHAARQGEAMPKRPRRNLDTWNTVMGRVAGEPRPVAIEGRQPVAREEAALGQHRVETCASVPFAHDEPIALGPFRPRGVDVQYIAVEHRQDLGHRSEE